MKIGADMARSILKKNAKDGNVVFVLFRTNKEVLNFIYECIKDTIYVRGLGLIQTAFDSQYFKWQHNLIIKLYHPNLHIEFNEARSIITKIPTSYLKRGVKTAFKNKKPKQWWNTSEQTQLGVGDTHNLFFNLFKDINSIEELKETMLDPNINIDKSEMGKSKKKFLLSLSSSSPLITSNDITNYIGTYHSSKGLECDNAILSDFIPPKNSSLNEERCLTFTGMTRTKNVDYIIPAEGYGGLIERDIR